jgi:predicted ATPase
VKATQEQTEALIALSHEQGFTLREASGVTLRGWALAEQGRGEEGIAQIRQGLAATQALGADLLRPHFLALLAEAYGKAEQGEQGLAALAEALAFVDKTGQRQGKAELYRLKGELTLKQSGVLSSASEVPNTHHPPPSTQTEAEAEARRVGIAHQNVAISEAGAVGGAHPTREGEAEEYFWQAIKIARRQQAKSLELRAVVSLSRLWQKQGRKEEARKMLAEIYHWFTEGFDTKDLQEAKALLEELS